MAATYELLADALQKGQRPAETAQARRQTSAVHERLAADFPANETYQRDAAKSFLDLGALEREQGRLTEAERPLRRNGPGPTSVQRGWPKVGHELASLLGHRGRRSEPCR